MCNCGLCAHCFFWLVCAKERPHFNCVLVPHADVQGDKLNVTCITGPTSPFASSSVVKASCILVRYQIFMNAKCRPAVHLNDAAFPLSLPRFIYLFLLACTRAPARLQTSWSCFSQARLSSLALSHTYVMVCGSSPVGHCSSSHISELTPTSPPWSRRLHFFYFVG